MLVILHCAIVLKRLDQIKKVYFSIILGYLSCCFIFLSEQDFLFVYISLINTTIFLVSPSKPIIDVINENTQLRCHADGNPTPQISWVMPAGNTSPNPASGSSVIRIISPNDIARQNDTYICLADNKIAPSTSSNITTAEAVTYVEGWCIAVMLLCQCFSVICSLSFLFYSRLLELIYHTWRISNRSIITRYAYHVFSKRCKRSMEQR